MAFKCAHCKGRHDTVAEGRNCSLEHQGGPVTVTRTSPSIESFADNVLTPKKQEYLSDLLGQFFLSLTGDLTPATIDYMAGDKILKAMIDARRNKTMGKAFTFPDGVQMLPHPGRGRSRERTSTYAPMPDVPAGHYAIPSLTGNNDLDFFRIKRPTDGQWAGRTFVDRVIGGHPDTSVRGKTARAALEAILAFGVEDAGILYGATLGQCRRCNRTLTDELSRALGIGPECRSKES